MAESKYSPKHINYALVESTRPPMYRAMKYWGRKPHNIWSDYIDHYCPPDGIVLDPFMGSGISTFESLKLGRRIVSTDLNPLSSFVVETLSSKFYKKEFQDTVDGIKDSVERDCVYKEHYLRRINGENYTIYNYFWQNGSVSLLRLKNGKGDSLSINAESIDIKNANEMKSLDIPYWYPQDKFPKNPSITHKFISNIGGNSFENLWTRRNLYLLSLIFNEILNSDKKVRLHLMYAFVHTLHLVCKMVVPRGETGNRDFSGSWGRADYMIRNRSMEQNPLIVFLRSCFDKQGVVSAMQDATNTLPQKKKLNYVTQGKKINLSADINYGPLDVADLCDYLEDNSIDFILTDPPYGGLVQYMDLSLVWLVWLQHFNAKYKPDSSGEITYKKGITARENYYGKLVRAFKNMYQVLKPDHYMVVTFHSQDIKEWNDFVSAIREAGFVFEKVTHQYNKRSGESNVANPYGTTTSDFYIRCKKSEVKDRTDNKVDLKRFVLQKTIAILTDRSEPTPFTFIINGLIPAMLQAGYLNPGAQEIEIKNILEREVGDGKVFKIIDELHDKAGDYYWFNNPSDYINHTNIPLSERVDTTIRAILRRNISVRYDDIVAEIFKEFPNGSTPDMQRIASVVSKYAVRSKSKWKIKDEVEHECTNHTLIISKICEIARKGHFESFVGRREQYECVNSSTPLSNLATYCSLGNVLDNYNDRQLARIEMMDCVLIKNKKIAAVFEVENSTNFTDAVMRASNIEADIPKFMVIPENRETELKNFNDSIFVDSFKGQSWHYILYDDIRLLTTSRTVSLKDIKAISKSL